MFDDKLKNEAQGFIVGVVLCKSLLCCSFCAVVSGVGADRATAPIFAQQGACIYVFLLFTGSRGRCRTWSVEIEWSNLSELISGAF